MRQIPAAAFVLLVCLVALTPVYVLGQRPAGSSPPPLRKDQCEDQVKQATAEGFTQGTALESNFFTTPLEGTDQRLKIKIVVEDLDGADAFRLAAAEIIRTQFPEKLEIAPDAKLNLYISGTKSMQIRPGYDVQEYEVEVSTVIPHWFVLGSQRHQVLGNFVVANAGGTLSGFTTERKTQVMREETYKVLIDFLGKWQQPSQ